MFTQAAMGVLALILGVLTIAGVVQLWHVYVLAFLSGSALALDAPVRQAFVAEMVGDEDLPNAVALNSMSF
jgi:MFS family permease